jgi:hypothetical protein
MGATIAQIHDLFDMRHETREILEIVPELVDFIDRSMDINRLLNIDCAGIPTPNSGQAGNGHIGNAARHQPQAEQAQRGTDETAARPAIDGQHAPAHSGQKAGGGSPGRPVPVRHGAIPLQSGHVIRGWVNFQLVVHTGYPARHRYSRDYFFNFIRQDWTG